MIVSHRQYLHLHMSNVGGSEFLLTVIYASNKREEWKQVWEGPINFSASTGGIPWIALGDSMKAPAFRRVWDKVFMLMDAPLNFYMPQKLLTLGTPISRW